MGDILQKKSCKKVVLEKQINFNGMTHSFVQLHQFDANVESSMFLILIWHIGFSQFSAAVT